MAQDINGILEKYTGDIYKLYGDQLREVILFGSYARGDFKQDSDIDIMILVDLDKQEILAKGHSLSEMTFEYDFEFGLAIMPIVKNVDHFNKWIRSYPFYYNIKKEGVKLYGA